MTKHTPGPWTVLYCPIHPPEHVAWNICAHIADKNGVKIPKTSSNMQLQAAAPDLLAALEDLEQIAGLAASHDDPARVAARAAIAKAKGEV